MEIFLYSLRTRRRAKSAIAAADYSLIPIPRQYMLIDSAVNVGYRFIALVSKQET